MVYKATGELKLMKLVWGMSNKRSFISGRNLSSYENSELFPSCCAHILSKKQFPYFRLYLRNITLLEPTTEHAIYDQGTLDDRKKYSSQWPSTKWDLLDDLRVDLIKEYNSTFGAEGFVAGVQMRYFLSEIKEKIFDLNCELLEQLEEDDFVTLEQKISATKLLAGL